MQYRDLKKDKNNVPTYDSLLPITLKVVANNDSDSRSDITDKVEAYVFSLYKNVDNLFNKETFEKNIQFSISYLYSQYNLIDRPFRAHYAVNRKGKEFLSQYSTYLSLFRAIKSLPVPGNSDSRRVKKRSKIREQNNDIDSIGTSVKKYNDQLKKKLIGEILKKNNSRFFEYLVTTLLSKMGYKGVDTTQATRDAGIDNVVNQDPLGMNTFMIQDKMYEPSHRVSSKEIRNFKGSLSYRNTTKGVFITTSDFTNDAKRQAKSMGIVMINGNQLAKLMLLYHVGVQTREEYEILKIDNDFFE